MAISRERKKKKKPNPKTPIDYIDPSDWRCYITNSNYIGCTTNASRRIRQHRGQRTGGAKRTRKAAKTYGDRLRMVAVVGRFMNKRDAMMFEWAWDKWRPEGRKSKPTLKQRLEYLATVLDGPSTKRWTSNAIPLGDERRAALTPFTIQWCSHAELVRHLIPASTRVVHRGLQPV
jgi:predicted GIY-YIG superfamily endonuclease